MSTYLYLQCLSHTPTVIAPQESGQHLYDLPRIRAEIAENLTSEQWEETEEELNRTFQHQGSRMRVERYFRMNSAGFLQDHADCRLGIIDEYGDTYPAEEPDPMSTHHDPRDCTCSEHSSPLMPRPSQEVWQEAVSQWYAFWEARWKEAANQRDERDAAAQLWKETARSLAKRLRAEQPRPLTPGDITAKMVERAVAAYSGSMAGTRGDHMRDVLTAALTEPPTRPEGAEELATLIGDGMEAQNWHDNYDSLADWLAERGVRVTGAES